MSFSNSAFDKNYVTYFDENNVSLRVTQLSNNGNFTTPANTSYITFRFGISNSVSGTTYSTNIMLNKGTTTLPYTAYKGTIDTYTIPMYISLNQEGYGWGVNDTCYNYIDFENKKFVQNVARVDLGSLDWTYSNSWGNDNMHFESNALSNCAIFNNSTLPNVLCSKYNTTIFNTMLSSFVDNAITIHSSKVVCIQDSSYTDATAFKTAMSGVYLYYELATPVETDISSYLGDKHIPIEANGSLTFTNTYNQAVPSSITYDCGLVEVVKTNHEHDIEQQKDIDNLKENKQDKIDSSHKLSADNVDDTSTTHKFVSATEKETWNGKQDVIHLYQHTIVAESTEANKQCTICFTILNSSATPITAIIDVWNYLYNNNNSIKLQASGVMFYSNSYETVAYLSSDLDIYDDSHYIYVIGKQHSQLGELFDSLATITDTVKQLF